MTIGRTRNPSRWHREIRAAVIEAGLTLDENSDGAIKVALEYIAGKVLFQRAVESNDRCCDACNCVALANVISELRAVPAFGEEGSKSDG